MDTENYILEYNEAQGKFHFNDGSMLPGSFGWITICKCLSYHQCLEFASLMEQKFPSIKSTAKETAFPDVETIQDEFVEFLLS